MRGAIFFVMTMCLLVIAPAAARAAGDPVKGHELAKHRCSRCHNIEKGGAFKERPPSFQSIAIYRSEADIWSRIVAPSPHAGMPEVAWDMSPEDVQNILAYIVSLDVN
jgi:mono/diheme cytochrome c family protein